jgi:hypothetical protein
MVFQLSRPVVPVSFFCAALALLAPTAARAQPVIELAPEHQAAPPPRPLVGLGAGTAPSNEIVWGLVEQRFRSAAASVSHTSVGGYGDIQLEGTKVGGGGRDFQVDINRMVIFIAHTFTDTIRIYTEFEWEHAKACSDCKGEASVEQAYVEWKVLGDLAGLRAGLMLVPMGITNEWHEPPVFNGVNRPDVETVVIPTTWREIGVGLFGRPTPWMRYQLYAMTALDPKSLSASGLHDAQEEGSLAGANAWSGAARVEVEPILGAVLGASAYGSDAGPNAKLYPSTHARAGVSVPIFGWDLDARFRRSGLEAKLLYTEWYLPGAGALMRSVDDKGHANFADKSRPVPTRMRGAYVEAGYDVLHPFGLSHQLVPFARVEAYDTQVAVPTGTTPDRTQDVRALTVGLSYRPIQQVVLKTDFQYRAYQSGPSQNQINVGVGFMY